jgi:hypothetical protein
MSGCTATLCVWITGFGDPCHIEDKETWFVTLTDCEGKVVEWCKRKFSFIPAKCGHAEIEIPPGCYTVFAGHSPQGKGVQPFGNRLTHVQVVRANCGDRVCVTLFSPSMWYCGTWFAHAVKTQLAGLERGKVNREIATAAVKAVEALMGELTPDDYGVKTLRGFDEGPPK